MTENFLIINSIKITFPINLFTILQQCEILGIRVPRFCYHEKLSIAGNCRICLVEVSNSFKLVVSCATMISKNISINTISNVVKHSRENILEMLLINHPLDCPICDQGGECDLQDQAILYGKDRSKFKEIKRSVFDKNLSPFIKTIMTRCIHCTRCIRYFNEIVGYKFLGTVGRGSQMEISNYIYTHDTTELSGNVVDLCPVGALTSKPFAFSARPWELINIESIDLLDSFCSKIRVSMKGEQIMRILPSNTPSINESWITNKIRFSYDAFTIQRIYTPKIKNSHTAFYNDVSWKNLFKYIKYNIYKFMQSDNFMNHFYAFTGKFIDLNTLILFKCFSKVLQIDNLNSHIVFENDFYQSYLLNINSTLQTEDSKVFIIYGINTKLENSIYNIKLRKLQLATNSLIYYIGNKINVNYKFIHIGLSLSNLLETYYGATEICYDLVKSKNTFFISGEGSSTDEYNNIHLIKKLDSNLSPTIEFLYNNLFAGEVAVLDLNVKSKIYCNIEDKDLELPKFIYFLGFENFQTLELNCSNMFIISHGHHFNSLSNRANVLIPSPTFIEKNGFYMDCYGIIHQNNSITLNKTCYDEYYIINGLWQYLASDFKNIYAPNQKIPTYLLDTNYYFNLKILNYRFEAPMYILSNNILKNNYFKKQVVDEAWFFYIEKNFYNMDIISQNSLILSKNLEKVKILSNFQY